jgi:hypothetical protein
MTPHSTVATSGRANRNKAASRAKRLTLAGLSLAAAITMLAACGGGSGTATPGGTTPGASAPVDNGAQVLPVASNQIDNTATATTLTIDSVLVENNVDPATGKDADDHLEIALTNTGTTDLSGFEVYYTYDDPTTGDSESYYTQLPASFTIPAGGNRVVHFDGSGAPDHFPDNAFSLYHTSMNALDVTVDVSATDAAPQIMTVAKDPGGEEVAD